MAFRNLERTGANQMVDFVVVVSAKRTEKGQQHVDARLAKNECIMCEVVPFGKPQALGICRRCRHQFLSELLAMDEVEQGEFRARLIRSGRILRPYEILRIRRRSLIQSLADRVKSMNSVKRIVK